MKELLAENDLHAGPTADYIYLNSAPIGEVNPTTGKLYYTHTDRLGTPQKLTDSTKTVVWNASYNPFGNTSLVTGTLSTQSLRLPGQTIDPETGMNHNGFRDYAGSLTRYVESDPIGLKGGTNTFQYVKGNPFKFVDLYGLDAHPTLLGPANGTDLSTWADSYKPSNYNTIVVHGLDPSAVYYDNNAGGLVEFRSQGLGQGYTAQDLANALKNDPKYDPNLPVRLIICEAGKTDAAKHVANALGRPVWASSDDITPSYDPNGQVIPGGPPYSKQTNAPAQFTMVPPGPK